MFNLLFCSFWVELRSFLYYWRYNQFLSFFFNFGFFFYLRYFFRSCLR
uniref:Uncharacterized protein n=1 Tax=virus sp. ctML55 TaxID=2827627 RepID=A0A8S5RHP3_9VIRU|nr:MAG TPA: hypothetical protein [virus sp. ctML55]